MEQQPDVYGYKHKEKKIGNWREEHGNKEQWIWSYEENVLCQSSVLYIGGGRAMGRKC